MSGAGQGEPAPGLDRIRAAYADVKWSERPVVGPEDMPDRPIEPGVDRMRAAMQVLQEKRNG